VGLAARGLRDMDSGAVQIGDGEELAQVRQQARGVRTKALILAATLTAVFLVLSLGW
jgi:hypothetical protein